MNTSPEHTDESIERALRAAGRVFVLFGFHIAVGVVAFVLWVAMVNARQWACLWEDGGGRWTLVGVYFIVFALSWLLTPLIPPIVNRGGRHISGWVASLIWFLTIVAIAGTITIFLEPADCSLF